MEGSCNISTYHTTRGQRTQGIHDVTCDLFHDLHHHNHTINFGQNICSKSPRSIGWHWLPLSRKPVAGYPARQGISTTKACTRDPFIDQWWLATQQDAWNLCRDPFIDQWWLVTQQDAWMYGRMD
eukprot:7353790-Karenia_brevis.AAC.1